MKMIFKGIEILQIEENFYVYEDEFSFREFHTVDEAKAYINSILG